MASSNKDQQPVNLATRMESSWLNQLSLDDIKVIAATQDIDWNAGNEHGWSPLMIACAREEIETVKFFLDHGADPTLKSAKDGNTPMHCASVGYLCKAENQFGYFSHSETKSNMQRKLDILRLLINHGATLTKNSKGLSPPCLAAIYNFEDIVEFFVQKNVSYELQLSDAERARAYELLGVALGLNTDLNLHDSGEKNGLCTCTYFCKALSIYEECGIALFRDHEKSEIAALLSLLSAKEYKTQQDWEFIKTNTRCFEIQCFVVAERVLPEEIKNIYLMAKVLKHAEDGLFNSGVYRDRLQGSKILRQALQWELRSKLELGSVLVTIVRGIRFAESRLDDDLMKECHELLDLCLPVFSEHKLEPDLVCHVGAFLYDLALYNFLKSNVMFESLLQFGEKLVRFFRRKSGEKNLASITHFILIRINMVFWRSAIKREQIEVDRRQRMKENRVKRLISRMVMCEDATQIDDTTGDRYYSMLHSLLLDVRYATQQFTKETALILIRNGCDIEARNAKGMTVREMICNKSRFDPDAPENEELMTLISPPTTVMPLQEIAARTILRHKIPHEGTLPRHISVIVTGELEPDSELFPQYGPSDTDTHSLWFESDSSLADSTCTSYHESDSSLADSTSYHESDSSLADSTSYHESDSSLHDSISDYESDSSLHDSISD